MLRANNSNSAKYNVKPNSITEQARKRTTTPNKMSPERKARRMTISPQTMIPRTPLTISKQQSMRDRRLSYLPPPRRESMLHRPPVSPQRKSLVSPQRKTLVSPQRKTPVSPQRKAPVSPQQKTLISPQRKTTIISKTKAITSTEDTNENNKRELPVEQPSARLLDAYGIPVTQRPRLSASTLNEQGSLEEFMQSKSKVSLTAKPIVTSTAATAVTGISDLNQRIRVCVRKRPLSKKEIANQESDIAPLVGSRTIQLNVPK
jgi:hypothetical protein